LRQAHPILVALEKYDRRKRLPDGNHEVQYSRNLPISAKMATSAACCTAQKEEYLVVENENLDLSGSKCKLVDEIHSEHTTVKAITEADKFEYNLVHSDSVFYSTPLNRNISLLLWKESR
jgi:hypothetical protein